MHIEVHYLCLFRASMNSLIGQTCGSTYQRKVNRNKNATWNWQVKCACQQ